MVLAIIGLVAIPTKKNSHQVKRAIYVTQTHLFVLRTPSSTSKSPKKKITENEKLKSSKSQSRSKSPQKKATDKKVDTPVHKPKSPKGLKSPKKA